MTYFLLALGVIYSAQVLWYFVGREGTTEFHRGIVWLVLLLGLGAIVGAELLFDLLRSLARLPR